MAEIIAGVGVSHIPTLGVVMSGAPADGEAQRIHQTFEPVRHWIRNQQLDSLIVVYNDHAAAFSLEMLPTFAIGAAPYYEPADEGYGAPEIPTVPGDVDLSWHLIDSVIPAGFDLVVCQKLEVDHGLTVPLTVLFGTPDRWPVKVVPIAVNVVQQPTPSARRCLELGKSIGRAVATFEGGQRIGIIGTGGMSHQLQGSRAGHINTEFDQMFLERIVDDPDTLAELSNTELIELAGSEGAELVMWLVMRGALGETPSVAYSGYHVPVSSTAAGILALQQTASAETFGAPGAHSCPVGS